MSSSHLSARASGVGSFVDQRSLPLPVVGGDLSVPVLGGASVRYTNLDYAASAPCLVAVKDALDEALRWYSSVHRGAGFPSTVATELLAASRIAVRRFVGGRDDDSVVFTRNTTDALNLLSTALPADGVVVTFDTEHHANLLPWRRQQVVHLPAPASPQEALTALSEAIASLGSRASLVAVTGASNVTGEVWPIAEIAAVAHRHGARIVVDAAQLAPHRHIDIAASDIDYVALSAHKLYAPFGSGALIGRGDWLDGTDPYLAGGGAVRVVTVDGVEWANGHARHEAGTPNVLGAVALATACRTLASIGFDAIGDHEAVLSDIVRTGLDGISGLRQYDLWGADSDRIGVVAFNLEGWSHGELAAVLSAEYGIGVRDGTFCAQPLVSRIVGNRWSISGAVAPGAVRASFGIGTSASDVRRLVDAVRAISRNGARGRYRVDDGRVVPATDDRARPELLAFLRGDDARTVEGALCSA